MIRCNRCNRELKSDIHKAFGANFGPECINKIKATWTYTYDGERRLNLKMFPALAKLRRDTDAQFNITRLTDRFKDSPADAKNFFIESQSLIFGLGFDFWVQAYEAGMTAKELGTKHHLARKAAAGRI